MGGRNQPRQAIMSEEYFSKRYKHRKLFSVIVKFSSVSKKGCKAIARSEGRWRVRAAPSWSRVKRLPTDGLWRPNEGQHWVTTENAQTPHKRTNAQTQNRIFLIFHRFYSEFVRLCVCVCAFVRPAAEPLHKLFFFNKKFDFLCCAVVTQNK